MNFNINKGIKMTSYFHYIASKFFSHLQVHVLICNPMGLYLLPIFTIKKGSSHLKAQGLISRISRVNENARWDKTKLLQLYARKLKCFSSIANYSPLETLQTHLATGK